MSFSEQSVGMQVLEGLAVTTAAVCGPLLVAGMLNVGHGASQPPKAADVGVFVPTIGALAGPSAGRPGFDVVDTCVDAQPADDAEPNGDMSGSISPTNIAVFDLTGTKAKPAITELNVGDVVNQNGTSTTENITGPGVADWPPSDQPDYSEVWNWGDTEAVRSAVQFGLDRYPFAQENIPLSSVSDAEAANGDNIGSPAGQLACRVVVSQSTRVSGGKTVGQLSKGTTIAWSSAEGAGSSNADPVLGAPYLMMTKGTGPATIPVVSGPVEIFAAVS